jgi:hypothetical protein
MKQVDPHGGDRGLESCVACYLQSEGLTLSSLIPARLEILLAQWAIWRRDRIDARVLLQMSEVINQHPERKNTFVPYLMPTGRFWLRWWSDADSSRSCLQPNETDYIPRIL